MPQVDVKGDHLSFGIEHEFGDWDTKIPLPKGFARSPDHTIVNTNGVAAQPQTKVYRYGGEINTPPSNHPRGQVEFLEELLGLFGKTPPVVNHRSNLHVHIRVPGLKDSLPMLKQVQRFIHDELPQYIDDVEPIPRGTTPAEKKRARRRKVSHHTFLTRKRLEYQLASKTVQEFFEREVPKSKAGVIMWHAQPRVCVNLRQLRQTDTVEFRHFPGTYSSVELRTSIEWCREFILCALKNFPLSGIAERFTARGGCFPYFPEFDEEREIRYQATAAKNGLTLMEQLNNIDAILKGKFNAQDCPEAYRKAQERAGCLPRKHA